MPSPDAPTRFDDPSAPAACEAPESGPAPAPRALPVDRRGFLQAVGTGAAAALGLGSAGLRPEPAGAREREREREHGEPAAREGRRAAAWRVRVAAATLASQRPRARQLANGEERDTPYLANYSKGLPHDALGRVLPAAYRSLLRALESRDPRRFEQIQLGLGRKLTSPQAGLAFDLEGPDSHHLTIRPAPRIDSPWNSGEIAELYWMALARDVHFSDYGLEAITAEALDDLSGFSDFRGPTQRGEVTPATLFRGSTPGDLAGPWLSQLLWLDVPFGAQVISQRNETALPGFAYLTGYDDWLAAQDGAELAGTDALDPERRYLRNLRDLARWVQVDALYQAYLNACLILLGLGCPLNEGNPLKRSATQLGFAEWGGPHILSLVTEVATRALKAVWYQKWFVHRRHRPENMGGLLHHHLTGAATYPIDPEILDSPVLDRVFRLTGTYLLPQAYPEGSPTHPSYGAGHATVAGACVTILKAWFDESFEIADPVVASADGLSLEPFAGPPLTVGGELDKLATNVATGRNGAGIHWRSDTSESLRLGERVAIGILQEQALTHRQRPHLRFTSFDGATVTI